MVYIYIIFIKYFKDTFYLQMDGASTFIEVNEKGIAWDNDKGTKFKRAPNSSFIQWLDAEDGFYF